MRPTTIHKIIIGSLLLVFAGLTSLHAQFLLQAPNNSDEHNYKWYEASDTNTVLGTQFFYEATTPGIYFATYDGTLCGSNATGYFILTYCNAPENEVTLDISANVPIGATVGWTPILSGDQLRPKVTASQSVATYTATIVKVGNSIELPKFTVVCMNQASNLVDDLVVVKEDESIVVPIFDNDSGIPTVGTLSTSTPFNGTVAVNDNNTPNDPSDDVLTYVPNPNFNGQGTFTYTICNSMGDCSTATVTITVVPVVDAFNDLFYTSQNETVQITDWSLNDNDIPSIGTLVTTDPTNGSISVNNNGTPNDPSDDTMVYVPNDDSTGSDSFTYTICDNQGNCSTATITIVVNGPDMVDLDSDNDGILDSFEDLNLDVDADPATNATDSDMDGVPDYLDLDSDNDGIPDNVEAQATDSYVPPSGLDLNNNGLDDVYEGNGSIGLFPVDTDGDGLPDYLDVDSDGDEVPDSTEAYDNDHTGFPNLVATGSDKNNNGMDDIYEPSMITSTGNTNITDPFAFFPNTDGDGESDYRDDDDDDDGIGTIDEDYDRDGNYANDDADADGIPDYLDSDLVELASDKIEVFNVVTPNGDGIHDVLKISGLENYPNNTLTIFNRWGVLVFVTKSYNTSGNVFDGTSNGRVTVEKDNKLPVGTYFYILDYEEKAGQMKSLTGYIYINR
ncbi:MAG: gliding motility-associated C-terminal domain-containing protein [Sediminicola sp.]